MKKGKKTASRPKGERSKDLWKNPSYRNMLNPYESKYPQPKKKNTTSTTKYTKNTK